MSEVLGPSHEDTGEGRRKSEKSLHWRARMRIDAITYDFDNPPEGVVFLGDPLPEAVADVLYESITLSMSPARRRRGK